MIAAISWIPKGASKSEPVLAAPPSNEDVEELITLFHAQSFEREDEDGVVVDGDSNNKHSDEVVQALAVAEAIGKTPTVEYDDIALALKDLDMDHYDDEDEGVKLFSSGVGDLYYGNNEEDPYIKDNNDEDSDEEQDMIIHPTDSVIVCARHEDESSFLEVWILEDAGTAEMNKYIHHDIMIPAPPLCTAWLDCPLKGGDKGNFLAVGSMEPSIEIWDLDVIDEVQPCVVLGGIAETNRNRNQESSINYRDGSHTGPVLGLAWNKEYRNILASASADKQVKIWDVVAGKCDITLEHHSDKVQAVAWNHYQPQVLLTGSFDHTVALKDGRMPSHSGYRWSVNSDVESLAWDPHAEHFFVVSLEDGTIKCFDIRTAQSDPTSELSSAASAFTLHAHDQAVTSVSYNPSAPNLLATGSVDKTVKLWDLSNNQPSCVASKNPNLGAVFSIVFSEDNPFLLAIGGSDGDLDIWNTLSESEIARRFLNTSRNRLQAGS